MRTLSKITLGLATASLLVVGLAACSAPTASSTASSAPTAAAAAKPLASIPALEGVDTQVALDKGFVAALTSLGLTPGVTGTATLVDGALHFPITGGKVDYYDPNASYRPFVQGVIEHKGSGITLTAGSTVVGLSDFKIDPGTSRLTGTVTANGALVANDVFIFNLDGSTLKPLATDAKGNAVLEGTRVLISSDAAALLNKTFNTTAVTDKLLVGIAKITAHAK